MKYTIKRIILLMAVAVLAAGLCGCNNQQTGKSASKESTSSAPAVKKSAPKGPEFLGGKVEETMNSGGYTYMLLSIGNDKLWVAVPQMQVKVGDDVVLMPGNEMHNFRSKTLNRTFESIIFSPGPVGGGSAHGGMGSGGMAGGMGSAPSHGKTVAPIHSEIKVEKAQGDNAYTVAEIYAKADELVGKDVKVRGQVVKVAHGIMGKNWIHIQDGTGAVDKGNFDLTVTTKADPAQGAVVTIVGKLAKDKDFGFGYHYAVIVEDATVE